MERGLSWSGIVWCVAGACVFECFGLVATLATGTTAQALYAAHVTIPALLVSSYHFPFYDSGRTGSLSLIAIAMVATLVAASWRVPPEVRAPRLRLLKLAVGVGLFASFCYDARLTLTGSLIFSWLLIVDVPRGSGAAYSNRLFLALLCPLYSLQLYPMAGEQVIWAALPPMIAAAVLIGDGMERVEGRLQRRLAPLLTIATLAVFVWAGAAAIERGKLWSDSEP